MKTKSMDITLETIYNLLKKQHKQTEEVLKAEVSKAFEAGKQARDKEVRSFFRLTEDKLKAYMDLKLNIERYKADIEDLKSESLSKESNKSKSIVFIPNGGVKLEDDEILEVKIQAIERKMKIDKEKIDEINYGLEAIKNDPDYMIIEYKYFYRWTEECIMQEMKCDKTTAWRKCKRLINRMAIRLYGGQVVS